MLVSCKLIVPYHLASCLVLCPVFGEEATPPGNSNLAILAIGYNNLLKHFITQHAQHGIIPSARGGHSRSMNHAFAEEAWPREPELTDLQGIRSERINSGLGNISSGCEQGHSERLAITSCMRLNMITCER